MNIFVSGSLAYDRIMDFPGKFSDHILPDKIHILNVCFTVNGMVEKFGGTAGNIAYTLSLLQEQPLILAAIGKDYREYFAWLERNRLPLDGIRIIPEELTAGAYITTDRSDNQITGFNPGAMKHPSGYEFRSSGGEALGLIAAGNLADMAGYAELYRSAGIQFICDPGQSLTAWDKKDLTEWIRGSMMLISNDYELELIMQMTSRTKKELFGLTAMIITTLGEKGSMVSTAREDITVPSAGVAKVVDPTGAGDAYRAGLVKGMVSGRNIEISARMGSVSAAYAVEKYGTQEHSFTYAEFCERYGMNFGAL